MILNLSHSFEACHELFCFYLYLIGEEIQKVTPVMLFSVTSQKFVAVEFQAFVFINAN